MSGNGTITWRFVPFSALNALELYELLQLRSEVFVLEQACAFQDLDGADIEAMHLLGVRDNRLVAYARCFAAGVKFAEASIGRVVTRASARGGGTGHAPQCSEPLSLLAHGKNPFVRQAGHYGETQAFVYGQRRVVVAVHAQCEGCGAGHEITPDRCSGHPPTGKVGSLSKTPTGV